ncbi:carbohydrate ABC transporter permease [Phaeobacter gallaeciensis]|uniref:Carbohydrate ABC transporter membrane protein 1, CUT1 family n=1 Tax=Phaeobacter gallaeciensis TaxID=60890 RepID=A0AAD0EF02_9RHOB|nr:sugar ABC transporter permease [Phaeobacter gallaeciensis]AHD11911.1 carbohydrate ABC transporter membrane protein 1, CUT1 family [Phaeobacter gallaeciensis DSM 26640]ATE95177.1 carbohydrate ABC transporter membrane protein 1, CUT1 family [Phaeobacter gallaeciensis]ATE99485.1 carbohydrate ABC transporter membrane protein 1, CUT1 family [Phaeobacter gallaeciensis]ATF03882.1 carbohydrate ABC transporter membrane protein 1, CUT1 family [Phaeobacter gallaeciensis]ATF08075.1 carbohydrate ABC tra
MTETTTQEVPDRAPPSPGLFRRDPNDPKTLPLLLIIPSQILLMGMMVFPFLLELWISLTNWQPTFGSLWEAEFASYFNYEELVLYEPRFLRALGRTLLFAVICLSLEFLLGLGLAILFLKAIPARKLLFSLLLSPMMIMPVVVGYTWFMLFQTNGPVNQIIGWVFLQSDLPQIEWFRHDATAFASIVVAEVWHWTPLFFLVLLSGLNAVPQNPIRAALMLGAGPLRIFWSVVLPNILPVIIIAFVIRTMEILKIFDEIFLMTRGGPGTATEMVSQYLYKLAFQDFRLAYAAAAAFIVLLLTVLGVNLMLRPVTRQILREE